MLKAEIHKSVLIEILRTIYSDKDLRTNLGFKGGTAAMLFYDLPRFSVDLDFDLLAPDAKDIVFEKIKSILSKYGQIIEATEKKYTLFFLINYAKGQRNTKVEISKRANSTNYEPKNYLGISMLVAVKPDMFACKLAALLTRKSFASRDLFDVWYFLSRKWEINDELLKTITGKSTAGALVGAQKVAKGVKKSEILSGLGELVSNKQKYFIKEKLVDEVVFLLKLYQSKMVEN